MEIISLWTIAINIHKFPLSTVCSSDMLISLDYLQRSLDYLQRSLDYLQRSLDYLQGSHPDFIIDYLQWRCTNLTTNYSQ